MTARGQAREAIPILERAAEASRGQLGATNWRSAEAQVALGEALLATGQRQRAESVFAEAMRTLAPQEKAQPRLVAAVKQAMRR